MSDIFLSYSRDDQAIARRFAQAFEREGFSVWWDQALVAGAIFDEVTEEALQNASAVVVLWSKKSVTSRWVRSEATQADTRGTLVPVMIEPCRRPIMFELMQSVELSHWKGDATDPAWQTLVADVRTFVAKADARAPAADDAPRKRAVGLAFGGRRFGAPLVAAVLAGMLGVAGGTWWLLARGPDGTAAAVAVSEEVTLAVLPFTNLSADPEQEYFSDGLTEEIMNELAQIKGLRLIARSSSFEFKGRNLGARVIGEKLGVKNLLEGSIRSNGKSVRVSAQLVSAVDGSNQWSKVYEGELTDVFELQAQIAKDAARALSIALDVGDSSRARGGTTNVNAYLEYLEGQAALATWRQREVGDATRHFAKAVELDPDFARALVMLTRARLRDATYESSPDQLVRVQNARSEAVPMLEHALQLAPDLADAYVERGDLNSFDNPDSAERDYRKAIELVPSDANAHQRLADLLYVGKKRWQEVAELMERAHTLAPLDRELEVNRALFLAYAFCRFGEADVILRQILEREPDYTPALIRRGEFLLFGLAQPVEAIRVLNEALELDPEGEFARRLLVMAHLSIGDVRGARELAEQPEASPVTRMFVARAERRVEEAAQLAYDAIDAGTLAGIDQAVAVTSIDIDARRNGHYESAAAALDIVLNIQWISDDQAVLGENRGSVSDVATYAGMLRTVGDERRAAALINATENELAESIALSGGVVKWHLLAQARLAALKGEYEEVLRILTKLNTEWPGEWMVQDGSDPLFEPLRGTPGYKAMLAGEPKRRADARRELGIP